MKSFRDWIYIDDFVDAFVSSINVYKRRIQYFDFGTGKITSLKETVELLTRLMGSTNDLLDFDRKRDRGDTEFSTCAKNFLPGWKSRISLEEGLTSLINSQWS